MLLLLLVQDCSSNLLKLAWKKGAAAGGKSGLEEKACVICDDALRNLCDVKHGRSYAVRSVTQQQLHFRALCL